jgi:hypothetical protein
MELYKRVENARMWGKESAASSADDDDKVKM